MIFKKTKYPIKIIKKLELKTVHYNDFSFWRWKKLIFPKEFNLKGRMNPHVVITGESGGGKSNAARVLIKEIAESGAAMAILDPNGDYVGIADSIGASVYDASRVGVNIFDHDEMSEQERAGEITAMLARRLRLGYVQSSMLKRCIGYTYWVNKPKNRIPSMSDLALTIKRFEAKAGKGEIRTLSVLRERVSLLNSMTHSRFLDLKKVMNSRSVFLIKSLHSEEAQSIYMEGLLRKIYSAMLSSGTPKRPFYLIIDEARKVSGSTVLGRLAAEGRKYGLGIMAVSQKSDEIEGKVMSNSSTIISFYQREPSELSYVSSYIAGGSESGRLTAVKMAMRNLKTGKAIILDSRYYEPILVEFDILASGDFCLKHYIEEISCDSIGKTELLDKLLGKGVVLQDVNAALADLTEEGILKEYRQWYISNPRNSAEHDIMLHLISKKLHSSGIPNEIYNSSYGPDIIAYEKGSRIAIEYETGKKNSEETARMLENRKKTYPKIILVANDDFHHRYLGMPGIITAKASSFLSGSVSEYL